MSNGKDLFCRAPDAVSICEVSPRDGLQNEATHLATEQKRLLVEALVASGLRRIEVTSFVSPKWVPQLGDAEELIRQLTPRENVVFSALCPNEKGLERARSVGLGEIAVFLSVSETHNRKNVNKSVEEALRVYAEIVTAATAQNVRVRAYVSTVWGCPYEGVIPTKKTVLLVEKLLALGCYQVSLGDTIGVGTPAQTEEIVRAVLGGASPSQVALHFHDTRGTALANAVIGLELGIRDFDASVAGVGGCPYAPGAAGNLATEDLVFMLDGMGVRTGVDLDRLIEAGALAEQLLGRRLPGKVHQAGPFRRRSA